MLWIWRLPWTRRVFWHNRRNQKKPRQWRHNCLFRFDKLMDRQNHPESMVKLRRLRRPQLTVKAIVTKRIKSWSSKSSMALAGNQCHHGIMVIWSSRLNLDRDEWFKNANISFFDRKIANDQRTFARKSSSLQSSSWVFKFVNSNLNLCVVFLS